MVTATSAVMIIVGVVALIGGYSLFRSMLPLWGFLLFGYLAYSFLPVIWNGAQAKTGLFQAIAFIVGGLVGAAVAIPLYYVIIFLTGAMLGGLAGVIVGAVIDVGGFSSIRNLVNFTNMAFPPIPQTNTQLVMMVIFGLLLGALAIGFQKFMIIASSSFIGSAALVSGLIAPINRISSSDMNQASVMLLAFLILAVLGMIVQFRMSGDV